MSGGGPQAHKLIREVFGEGTLATAHLAHFTPRPGQKALALAVARALDEGGQLLAEAGTGTGKTLAYLIPAILSGKKVVISTATRALQEQIALKDLPLAAAILGDYGITFRASMMKGLSNYICRRRLAEALAQRTHDHVLARIRDFAEDSATGDLGDAGFLSEDDSRRKLVATSAETRIGAGCSYYESCFITKMRRDAEQSDVVVVNHHLFFADLALRTGARGDFAAAICPYDAVIFDEAHQLEGIAGEFFGISISSGRVDTLLRDASRAGLAQGGTSEQLNARITETEKASDALFRGLDANADKRRTLAPEEILGPHRGAFERFDACLEGLATRALADAKDEALMQVARRSSELRRALRELLCGLEGASAEPEAQSHASHWIEKQNGRVIIGATPTDLATTLREKLWSRVGRVIMTSATLATSRKVDTADVASEGVRGDIEYDPESAPLAPALVKKSTFRPSFHYLRSRLGPPDACEELCVESPFAYRERVLLYLPRDIPEVNSPAFDRAAASRALELIEMTGGGAFVLSTSHRGLLALATTLRPALGSSLFVQGERPKSALLEAFRQHGSGVLLATMSFWEGVDVVGDALRLVIVDRLPFPVPSDPLVAARSRNLEQQGGNPFLELFVPQAAITLKQGFGRLLRSETDRGIVTILDKRITMKPYGKILLESLPPAPVVLDFDELRVRYAALFAVQTP